jgi:hypothetical protein
MQPLRSPGITPIPQNPVNPPTGPAPQTPQVSNPGVGANSTPIMASRPVPSNPMNSGMPGNQSAQEAPAQVTNPAAMSQSMQPTTLQEQLAQNYRRPVAGWPPQQEAPAQVTNPAMQPVMPQQPIDQPISQNSAMQPIGDNSYGQQNLDTPGGVTSWPDSTPDHMVIGAIGEEVTEVVEEESAPKKSFLGALKPTRRADRAELDQTQQIGDQGYYSGAAEDYGVYTDPAVQNPVEPGIIQRPEVSAMSDSAASNLFKEDSEPVKKKSKAKRTILTLLLVIITLAVASGTYIFIMGNKSAEGYEKDIKASGIGSSLDLVKKSLEGAETNTEEFAKAMQSLKDKTGTAKSIKLRTVPLGSLVPKYKNASDKQSQYSGLINDIAVYSDNYGQNLNLISSIESAFKPVLAGGTGASDVTNSIYAAKSVEDIALILNTEIKECESSIKTLTSLNVPEDYKELSKELIKTIQSTCVEAYSNILRGPILVGKTGTISEVDRNAVAEKVSEAMMSGLSALSGQLGYEMSKIEAYLGSAKDGASALKDRADKLGL